MNKRQSRITSLQALDGLGPAMCRTVVDNPENTTSLIVGRSRHHLFHQPVKGCNPILGLTATEDAGVMNIQGGHVQPAQVRHETGSKISLSR